MKLMYDEVSLGEIEDHSELSEYLESYSTDYFIGLESDQGWSEAVLTQVPHLFSIGRDPEKVHLQVAIASLLLYNTTVQKCNLMIVIHLYDTDQNNKSLINVNGIMLLMYV